jgi:hypothetical protein
MGETPIRPFVVFRVKKHLCNNALCMNAPAVFCDDLAFWQIYNLSKISGSLTIIVKSMGWHHEREVPSGAMKLGSASLRGLHASHYIRKYQRWRR